MREPPVGPPVLFGRETLFAAIERRLAAGGGVALHGPSGIGRTAVLDAVAAVAVGRGECVLRARPTEAERAVPFSGIGSLLAQLSPAELDGLSAGQVAAVAAISRGTVSGGTAGLARRLALSTLLARCARRRPVLLVLDDVQWLDPASRELLSDAVRRRPGSQVRVLAAQRWPDPMSVRRGAVRVCSAPTVVLAVPPLPPDDLAELLASRGLPYRIATRLHAESGGNPQLALILGSAATSDPPWRSGPLPQAARELLCRQIASLPAPIVDTLLFAALTTRPTLTRLVRAGRSDAERDIRVAVGAGVVALDGEVVRFTPPALATVLAEDVDAARRASIHHILAESAVDAAECARHRALRSGRPDAAAARSLVTAARAAAGRGAGRVAAELYLLAAERCPRRLAEDRLDWLLAAAQAAAGAGAPVLAGRAAEAVLDADAPAGHRVRARLVLIDLAGQALAEMDDTFAAALIDAGDDPALLAPLRLRLAWQAMVTGGVARAEVQATRAIAAARLVGDTDTESMALSVRAQAERVRGEAAWRSTLDAALALPQAPVSAWLHLSPRYLAARCALMDDRLDEARSDLLSMLAVTDRDHGGEGLVEVLRSLSEVATRAGRCHEALRYAERAVQVSQRGGLSPGPAWYTAAMAELVGGSIARAAGFARRGIRASEQEGDTIYLQRNLHALGQAALRAGDTRGGVAALCRLRDLETTLGSTDPLIVRWHGDLAGGLAALGEHSAAAATLAAARSAAHRLGATPGVTGYLERAAAVVLSESGQADAAVVLSAAAVHHFSLLRQPIEHGHALLVQGGAERRRRRYAAARAAIGAAMAIFLQADAKPWVAQTERALARTERTVSPSVTAGASAPEHGLTTTEARIAGLVRAGASNREIATQLYLSVKTVEATLTRVYRKLGVRSRTQLSSRLVGVEGQARAATRVFPDSMTTVDA